MTENAPEKPEPKLPGQIFIEELIKAGVINSIEDLTPDQLAHISELNQSQDMIGKWQEDLDKSTSS